MMVVAVSGNNNVVGCGCGGSGGGGNGSGGGGNGNGSGGKVGDEQFNATCKDGKVVLTWKAGDAFKLFREGQLLKEGTTETTYTDTVTDDKDYVYKLEQGSSSKSLTVNPKTLCQAASETPNDPKTLNLKAVCDNKKVKLTWNELTGSDGKKAHYNVSPGQNDLIVNYYVTDLAAGQQKSFNVSAFDSSNKPLASESLDVRYDQVCVPQFSCRGQLYSYTTYPNAQTVTNPYPSHSQFAPGCNNFEPGVKGRFYIPDVFTKIFSFKVRVSTYSIMINRNSGWVAGSPHVGLFNHVTEYARVAFAQSPQIDNFGSQHAYGWICPVDIVYSGPAIDLGTGLKVDFRVLDAALRGGRPHVHIWHKIEICGIKATTPST